MPLEKTIKGLRHNARKRKPLFTVERNPLRVMVIKKMARADIRAENILSRKKLSFKNIARGRRRRG